MINIVTGPPRAGKSYFITYWLFKNYLVFDKEFATYKMKDGALLVANIDGLKLPHKDLDRLLKTNNFLPEEFFIDAVQKDLADKHPTIIYIIDEAHKYFPAEMSKKSKVAKEVRDYFAYHGHYNQHFWLLTQDVSLMYQSIVKLAECEYQCVRSSLSPPGRFRYNLRVPGKMGKFNTVTLPKLKKVFNLYRSADNTETEKPKKTRAYLYLYIMIGFIVVTLSSFIYQISTYGKRGETKERQEMQVQEIKQNYKSSQGSTINQKARVKYMMPHEKTEDGLTWQQVACVYHDGTNSIEVFDRTFGWIDLKHFEYEFKIVNRHIFALLPVPQDSGEAGEEPETWGEGSDI